MKKVWQWPFLWLDLLGLLSGFIGLDLDRLLELHVTVAANGADLVITTAVQTCCYVRFGRCPLGHCAVRQTCELLSQPWSIENIETESASGGEFSKLGAHFLSADVRFLGTGQYKRMPLSSKSADGGLTSPESPFGKLATPFKATWNKTKVQDSNTLWTNLSEHDLQLGLSLLAMISSTTTFTFLSIRLQAVKNLSIVLVKTNYLKRWQQRRWDDLLPNSHRAWDIHLEISNDA